MLGGIDPEGMGRGIFANLRDGIRESLNAQAATQDDTTAAISFFDDSVRRVNPTDLARRVIDEHVLSRAVETIEREFTDQPLVRAALQRTVANTYRAIGLYEPAMPLQEAALQTRREKLGDGHPDTLGSINEMGVLLTSMAQYAEAEPYFREALEGRRRVLGDDHPNTLHSINNMGFLLQSQGKLAEAEPYYREALEGHRRVLGDDHPDTLASINNMGSLLRSQGKLTEAEPYHGEALEGNRRVLGDDHPGTLISKSNLALLLVDLGNAVEAEELAGEAVVAARETLGAEHWFYGNFLGKHGRALAALERFDDAESALLEAHGILQTAVGDEHLQTKRVVGYLADLYDAWHEAEPGRGYDAKAAEWRAKLAEEGTEASRDEGTKEKESDE
ncbi:MAG: tetratricopeptide repeat protein [Planctomycetes bacterium]|nr:tetratricopeptide repeat protein [Planctomycetota bacterium]